MKNARSYKLFSIVALLGLLALACTLGETPPTEVSGNSDEQAIQTLQAQLTANAGGEVPDTGVATATTAVGETPELVATDTPEFTPTPSMTPTITSTATPSVPMVKVSQNTNCRTGDSTAYDLIGALLVGETAEVVGRSAAGDYWIIQNPDRAGTCWLWGNYATVSGDTSGLPVMTPPPTPTPSNTPTKTPLPYDWNGNWTTWVNDTTAWAGPFVQTGNSVNATLTGAGSAWIKIAGTVSADGQTLSGTWEDSGGGSGDFTFQLKKNVNQFVGNWDNYSGAWCGARLGASHPSPCQGP